MRYVKINHNDPKQKEIDQKQKERCKKCNENCSTCSIYLYSGLFN